MNFKLGINLVAATSVFRHLPRPLRFRPIHR